jgi:hypothetical protein
MQSFELKDEHRIYLGLNPLRKDWDRVEFAKGFVCYFDKDVIKKTIFYDEDNTAFTERDEEIRTNRRNKIIPKTDRGKEKPITLTNILDYNAASTHFNFGFQPKPYINWYIGAIKLDAENNAPDLMGAKSLAQFDSKMADFIRSTPNDHLERIAKLKTTKKGRTKPVRFKMGDFFAVATKFDLYGTPTEYIFGRHLLNIAELRKRAVVDKIHHWRNLMTIVQLVTLYDYTASSLIVDLEAVKRSPKIPAFHMMDDALTRGEYPIVGNLPLEAEELDFPMHYGGYMHNDDREGFYFGWGVCMIDNVRAFEFNGNDTYERYRNNGVGFGASNISLLDELREDRPPYFEHTDILHPNVAELKEKILKSLGVKTDISYDDFCKKFGFMNRAELLAIAKNDKR